MRREKGRELRQDNVNFYLISLGLAQNKIRFTDTQLDGAAKGGLVHHINSGKRDEAQIKQALPHRTAGVVPFDADTASRGNVAEQPTFFPALALTALRAMMGAFLFRPPELHRKTFQHVISILP